MRNSQEHKIAKEATATATTTSDRREMKTTIVLVALALAINLCANGQQHIAPHRRGHWVRVRVYNCLI